MEIFSRENDGTVFLSSIPLEAFGQQSYIQDWIFGWWDSSLCTSPIFRDHISLSTWWFIILISPAKTIPQFGRFIRKVRMIGRKYFIICYSNYLRVATSHVRTSSSMKASFSGWFIASLADPQNARWCLRSSRFILWRSHILAFTWWAISAQ